MITLKVATLADAANVREGLLSIIGGGISVLRYPSYPVPLNADVALLFELAHVDAGATFDIRVDARRVAKNERDDDEPIFTVEARLTAGPVGDEPVTHRNAPLAIPLHNAGVPSPGLYRIEVMVDRIASGDITFLATTRDYLPGEMRSEQFVDVEDATI